MARSEPGTRRLEPQRHGIASFVMPEFYAPFPLERNPHLREASRRMWEWIGAMGLAPTEKAQARMRATGADLSGSYVWPRADLDLLATGLRWLALTFRIDDQIDEDDQDDRLAERAAVIADLRGILHGHPPVVGSVVTRALTQLWQETAKGRAEDWQRTFIGHFEAWLDSYSTEARLKTARRPPQLHEYLEWRRYSVGMPWLWDLGELTLPTLVPETIRECRPMRELRHAAALHIALVNDVYSVNRELLVGYPCNAVLIIQQQHSRSPQEAVDAVADQVADQVRVFQCARTALERELDKQDVSVGSRTAATAYAETCAANIRGQIAWHSQVRRYDIDDFRRASGSEPLASYPDDLLLRPSEGAVRETTL
ncbi:terpene synthase family protein [Streptomyces alanosinicus]|uniref:Terpene synthase n=1 Tax=Streptomyces alanosinicus TaxID=68171 RepID=A0A918INQ1_9ACTN|nr:terpene synthase family protein [Streptomyces alanosinicus]GGW24306.1 hypothetical protein GCM10010339_94140 [Streptomyces alanosinicus]